MYFLTHTFLLSMFLLDVGTLDPTAYRQTPLNLFINWAIGCAIGVGFVVYAYYYRKKHRNE